VSETTATNNSAPLTFGSLSAPLGGSSVLWKALSEAGVGQSVYATKNLQLEARTFTSTLSHREGKKWKGSWNANKSVLIIERTE
jgi:hypothetical protein